MVVAVLLQDTRLPSGRRLFDSVGRFPAVFVKKKKRAAIFRWEADHLRPFLWRQSRPSGFCAK